MILQTTVKDYCITQYKGPKGTKVSKVVQFQGIFIKPFPAWCSDLPFQGTRLIQNNYKQQDIWHQNKQKAIIKCNHPLIHVVKRHRPAIISSVRKERASLWASVGLREEIKWQKVGRAVEEEWKERWTERENLSFLWGVFTCTMSLNVQIIGSLPEQDVRSDYGRVKEDNSIFISSQALRAFPAETQHLHILAHLPQLLYCRLLVAFSRQT